MGSEIRLTADWVAAAMTGHIAGGDTRTAFAGVSIDTRSIRAGELYVGIRGDRFDGADFAGAAAAAGAAGVVVPRGRGGVLIASGQSAGAVVIEVDETTAALQAVSKAVRRASGAKVVAITGSAGKTTTKEVTAQFLGTKYRVIRNRGNLNNHIGLPLSLLELTSRPDVAVVELGMNHAGEIRTLVRIAEPDVRVWTNVGEAHLGFFASVDAIADAKAELLEDSTKSTVLVANGDDDRITARTRSFAGRKLTFGVELPADVQAFDVADRGIDGTTANVATPIGSFKLTTPLIGRGNLANILAATAVGVSLEVPLAAMAERATQLKPASHRGDVVRLAKGLVVVDDSYNANPTATLAALDVLRTSRMAGRRVAVLGEMLELGDRAIDLHEAVGRAAAAVPLDLLVAVGGAPARALANAAIAAGLAKLNVHYFEKSDEAADHSASWARAGDLVLVKGSRGVQTDKVVDRLKAEFA
jgi:UDP-N-acetylmuramoyl-tripeptide--D-alanyl-D-alanine ligase